MWTLIYLLLGIGVFALLFWLTFAINRHWS
jgi:hypothetical protein